MHGWNVQILVVFGIDGGEDNMPSLLWSTTHGSKSARGIPQGPSPSFGLSFSHFFPCSFL
jgi:hypothetical protein